VAPAKSITAELRRHFAAIADVLVPEYGRLPKASDVGVADELLDRVLAARPDLTEIFVRGLQTTLGRSGREAAEHLFKQDPEAFDAVSTAAAGGYYLDPKVRELIGYPGQESIPNETPYALPSYALDGSLQRVFDRGPIYKPTPGKAMIAHPRLIGSKA
jgi:hypothetical protein